MKLQFSSGGFIFDKKTRFTLIIFGDMHAMIKGWTPYRLCDVRYQHWPDNGRHQDIYAYIKTINMLVVCGPATAPPSGQVFLWDLYLVSQSRYKDQDCDSKVQKKEKFFSLI